MQRYYITCESITVFDIVHNEIRQGKICINEKYIADYEIYKITYLSVHFYPQIYLHQAL